RLEYVEIVSPTPKIRRRERPTTIARDQSRSPEVILVDSESLEELYPLNILVPAPNRQPAFSDNQTPSEPKRRAEVEKLGAEAMSAIHPEATYPQASPAYHGFTPINKGLSTRPKATI